MTEAKPPIYEYINGHAYMLASHAAEQMERCMLAVRPGKITPEDIAWAEKVIDSLEPVE